MKSAYGDKFRTSVLFLLPNEEKTCIMKNKDLFHLTRQEKHTQ